MGLGVKERLILGRREVEVAVYIATAAESQTQDLLLRVIDTGGEHLGFER